MEYYIGKAPETSALSHYGILGMKWGVRRYQNRDGTLTSAGRKRYNNMSDDKLQKTLYKQVRKVRSEQSDWSKQWNVNNTIGQYSKASQEKYIKDLKDHMNSTSFKVAERKIKKLEDKALRDEIDLDEYDAEYEKIQSSIYRSDLDNSVTYTNQGKKYSQDYINKYGKDLNIAYLKDLGYDERTAREFTERILKANTKMINGI